MAWADASGSCGDNVTYTYVSATNTLTISGTGAMTDYTYSYGSYGSINTPWYSFRSSIKKVIINNGVTSIGDETFAWCSGLTSVTIPNSVTSIGEFAFGNCSGLTSVTIPNSVTSIGDYAFQYCSGLTSVNIPNSVTSIGGSAFFGCSSLTSITIPNSVTSIGEGAFGGCSSLYVIINCKFIRQLFSNNSYIKHIILGDEVETVAAKAFEGFKNMETVTIGKNVSNIGERAFAGFDKLTDVTCYAAVVPKTDRTAFENSYTEQYATLHVPKNSIGDYKETGPWKYFKEIVEINGSGGETGKCATPTITYSEGKLKFSCATEGVEFVYEITCADNKKGKGSEVIETGKHTVTVYATKEGMEDSDAARLEYSPIGEMGENTGGVETPKHMLTYVVDGNVYMTYQIEEGENITAVAEPTKEGYTFTGWSEIPSTMPDHDIVATGSFTGNLYILTYLVDGEEYKTDEVECGMSIIHETEPSKEGYTFSGWSWIPSKMPSEDVTVTGSFIANRYTLTYMIDDAEYKKVEVEYGARITPETGLTKEGYTFAGWDNIPSTMPAEDITVTGTFSVNMYKLIYLVDGEEYETVEMEYGTYVSPEDSPTKEGYTFSGRVGLPSSMPSHDLIVTGTFSKDAYTLTYVVDGDTYKTVSCDYGQSITPEPAPMKEGYTFNGWYGKPNLMPMHDVTVIGIFTPNKHELTYEINGETYKSFIIEYGASITPEKTPTKEGHTFTVWSDIPSTMPDHDVTVTGTYSKDAYSLTYLVDGEEYKTVSYDFRATITPDPIPQGKEGYTFYGWSWIPSKMPDEDVTVTGCFIVNKYKLTYMIDGKVYKTVEVEYGATITPEPQPAGDYVSFRWTGLPETMPAKDVTVQADYVTDIKGTSARRSMVRIYDIQGNRISKPRKGVNIISESDGTVKKKLVK
jgi:hypothetical protein